MKRLIKAVIWILSAMLLLTSVTGCSLVQQYIAENEHVAVIDPTEAANVHGDDPMPTDVIDPIPADTPTPVPAETPTLVPAETPTPSPAPTNPYASVSVGDMIFFGEYEQDNNLSNGKEEIEWIVLAKENNKALIISKYALDCQKYNKSGTEVTWETCSLYKWLNETFLIEAFSDEEQNSILSTTFTADNKLTYSTSPNDNKTDKVFLLSIYEVSKYFSSDEARKCAATEYAIARGAWTSGKDSADGRATCWWWMRLRVPGYNFYYSFRVLGNGDYARNGRDVNTDGGGVRPALWIDLGPYSPTQTLTPTPEPAPMPTPEPISDLIVKFEDAAFEAAFRKKYGYTGEIHRSDILEITELVLPESGLRDISDVAQFTNLTWLNLYNNRIADITPLQDLTNLVWLQLTCNRITDVTPLQGLTNLMHLDLYMNEIADITPLQGLTKLTYLNLYSNQITDITPLQSLTNLEEYLCLAYNQISDITPLKGLTKLTDLCLINNKIVDITPLQCLTNLTHLDLQDNKIEDVTPLQSLTNLKELYLDKNRFKEQTKEELRKALPDCMIYYW